MTRDQFTAFSHAVRCVHSVCGGKSFIGHSPAHAPVIDGENIHVGGVFPTLQQMNMDCH